MIKFTSRLILAVIFASFGLFLARPDIWPNFPFVTFRFIPQLTALIFATLGFLAPDWIAILARSAIAQIAEKVTEQVTSQLAQRVPFVGSQARERRRSRPKKNNGKELKGSLILDTSSIIDGRILDVVKAGFLRGIVIVIPGVLSELRYIADSKDDLKRERGRLGLDILGKLKHEKSIKVKIMDSDPPGKEVDEKLIEIAKKTKGALVTVDYNLTKHASVANVQVVNINDLANALKSVALPGEEIEISVLHVGKEKTQGVGYMLDGTMVVVEDGAGLVGRRITAKVMRSFQTSAGRMIFVRHTNPAPVEN